MSLKDNLAPMLQKAMDFYIGTGSGATRMPLTRNEDDRARHMPVIFDTYHSDTVQAELTTPSDNNLLLSRVHTSPGSEVPATLLPIASITNRAADAASAVQFSSRYAPLLESATLAVRPNKTTLHTTLRDVVRMARNPMHLKYGDVFSGVREPWTGCAVAQVQGAWYNSDELTPAAATLLPKYCVQFLAWMTRALSLPSINDILSSTFPDAASMVAAASISELCDAIGMLHTSVQARMAATVSTFVQAVRQRCTGTNIQPSDFLVAQRVLETVSRAYLHWRYLVAPALADGARALLAYVASPEPVLYAGVAADWTVHGALAADTARMHYTIHHVVMGNDAELHISDLQSYAAIHYAMRVLETFSALPTNAFDVADSSSNTELSVAVASLMLQRWAALGHVASQYTPDSARLAATRDLSFYATRNAFVQSQLRALPELLRALRPHRFGAVAGARHDGRHVRSLLPPGVPRSVLPNMPASVVFSDAVACSIMPQPADFTNWLQRFERRHFRRRSECLQKLCEPLRQASNARLISIEPVHDTTHLSLLICRRSRFGCRIGPDDAAAGGGDDDDDGTKKGKARRAKGTGASADIGQPSAAAVAFGVPSLCPTGFVTLPPIVQKTSVQLVDLSATVKTQVAALREILNTHCVQESAGAGKNIIDDDDDDDDGYDDDDDDDDDDDEDDDDTNGTRRVAAASSSSPLTNAKRTAVRAETERGRLCAKRAKVAAAAPRRSGTAVTTRVLVAAYVYYYNHCTNVPIRIRMSRHRLREFCRALIPTPNDSHGNLRKIHTISQFSPLYPVAALFDKKPECLVRYLSSVTGAVLHAELARTQ